MVEILTRDGQKHKCLLPLTEEEKNTKEEEAPTIGNAEEYLNKAIQDTKTEFGQCFTAVRLLTNSPYFSSSLYLRSLFIFILLLIKYYYDDEE